MLEHDPENAYPALDSGVGTDFRRRSCSNNELKRDRDTTSSDRTSDPKSQTPMALSIWSMVRDGSAQPASPTILAGTPATVTLCGTALTTTEPAAMRAQ